MSSARFANPTELATVASGVALDLARLNLRYAHLARRYKLSRTKNIPIPHHVTAEMRTLEGHAPILRERMNNFFEDLPNDPAIEPLRRHLL